MRPIRYILGAAAVLVAVAAIAQTQPPPVAQAPAVPAQDPARAQLEERLKELQRRERFERLDPKTLQSVLTNIIDLCIELGRECPGEEKKLDDVEGQLDKAEQQATLAVRRAARVKQLKTRAYDALISNPPGWLEARQSADQALRLAPKDAEALDLKAKAERGLRDALIYRTILGVLGGVLGLGALVAAIRALKKGAGVRARQLEMLEGPSPGEAFTLEKETTTLGALAAEADWVIPDPARRISRRHCEISRSGRHYFLIDCSSNGTKINGQAAPKGEPVLLRKGDRIALAEDVIVRFG